MKIEYLESEEFFTSNGFFKNLELLGENFSIFGQYLLPTLSMLHRICRKYFLYHLKGTTSDGPIAPGLPGAKTKGECYPCPPGNYCFPGEEQKPCPSGTFQREPGASALSDCTPCLPGKSQRFGNPELTENSKDTIVCTRRRAM